jgi:hypothetical protein
MVRKSVDCSIRHAEGHLLKRNVPVARMEFRSLRLSEIVHRGIRNVLNEDIIRPHGIAKCIFVMHSLCVQVVLRHPSISNHLND